VARRVRDLENLVNEEAIARVGLQRHIKKTLLCKVAMVYLNISYQLRQPNTNSNGGISENGNPPSCF
jgi:hypothetical protein